MKALDTNVLIRFLVRDDEKQSLQVKNLLLKAEKSGESFFVSIPVILEVIWVLSSAYHYHKSEILLALQNLLLLPVIKLESHNLIATLCRIAPANNMDLADLLIGLSSEANGCENTLTFDKKAARSDLFTLIK